jgi:putative transposase
MSAKNSIKDYVSNSFYHIYNRGVEKRNIFLDNQDYAVFLSYLKEYLLPKDENILQNKLAEEDLPWRDRAGIVKALRMNNFYNEIILMAFCLMTNHFHLLIKQNEANTIDSFMNSICVRYSMYFNKKYGRVGKLFQGVYKAVLVNNEEYLLYLTRYIHIQAVKSGVVRPSSLDTYLGKSSIEWLNTDLILSYFSKTNRNLSYESFVFQPDDGNFGNISRLLLE